MSLRLSDKICSGVGLLAFCIALANCCNWYTSPRLDTKWGFVHGKWDQSVSGRPIVKYLGIPYALPPVDKLRFKSPQPWNKFWYNLCAQTEKPKCVYQKLVLSDVSEDCLYLNIYVQAVSFKPDEKMPLPVLVLVHGVPYVEGNGDSKLYRPNYLMEKNMVLVTVNYRLSILGFFSTGNQVSPGNYGLKDIVMALKWIQENIADFDGDPNSVTLMGSSTGSEMVHLLALSNKTQGLFHKYIMTSGSALSPWNMRRYDWTVYRGNCLRAAQYVKCLQKGVKLRTEDDPIYQGLKKHNLPITQPENPLYDIMNEGEEYPGSLSDLYNGFVNKLAPYNKSQHKFNLLEIYGRMMSCMRYADVTQLMELSKHYLTALDGSEYHFGPTLEVESEDAILTMHPAKILREGLFRDIPSIMIVMKDQGLAHIFRFILMKKYVYDVSWNELLNDFKGYLPHLLDYQEMIDDDGQFVDAVKNFYFNGNLTENLMRNITDVAGDAMITWPMHKALKFQSKYGKSNIFLFYLAYNGTFSFTVDCYTEQRGTILMNIGIENKWGNCHINRLTNILNLWTYEGPIKAGTYHSIDKFDDDMMVFVTTYLLYRFIDESKVELRFNDTMISANYRNFPQYVKLGDNKTIKIALEPNLLNDRMNFLDELMPKVLKENSVYRML